MCWGAQVTIDGHQVRVDDKKPMYMLQRGGRGGFGRGGGGYGEGGRGGRGYGDGGRGGFYGGRHGRGPPGGRGDALFTYTWNSMRAYAQEQTNYRLIKVVRLINIMSRTDDYHNWS